MIKLVKDFFEKVEEMEIRKEDIYYEESEDYSVISFGEEGEPNEIYNILLFFYNNENDVEIFVRKQTNNKKLLDTLIKLNSLNIEYRNMNFSAQEKMVCLKTYCQASGDINKVLKSMVMCMQVASTEFPKFK